MQRPVAPLALILFVGLSLLSLASPRAVAACSCVQISMDDAATQPEAVVFSGVVEPRDARGYPVTVTRWYKGGGVLEPRAWLHPGGFSLTGGGADCSVPPLPTGTEYIFIAYTFEGLYSVGLCSPHAAVATAEGQTMVADAVRVFGGGGPPATAPPTASPPGAPTAAPPTASPPATPSPSPTGGLDPGLPIVIAVLAVGAIVGGFATRRLLDRREG